MKIQITNLFFLSTVLLFISGCQELEQINLYNQSNLPLKNQENQLATKVIIVKTKNSISNRNEDLRNVLKPYINMSSLKQKLNSKYSLKSKLNPKTLYQIETKSLEIFLNLTPKCLV